MQLNIILYLVGFARTLLVIAIIYFAIRLFSRYVLPLLVQKGVKNMQQKMQNQFHEQQRKPGRKEGDVTIEKNKQGNAGSRNQGEYVDFEEVE